MTREIPAPSGEARRGLAGWVVSAASSTWLPRVLIVAILALHAAWSVYYVVDSERPGDFYVYYLAAYHFQRGVDVYSLGDQDQNGADWARLAQEAGVRVYTFPYRYPPTTAEIAWPLTLVGPRPALQIWLAISSLAFIGSALLIARLTAARWGKTLALGQLLFFIPALTTLRAGQINALLLLSLSVGIIYLIRQRAVPTGLAIATAAMLKLVPVALMGYLFWRRQWRAALVSVLGVVALFAASLPMIGWAGLASYARNFLTLGVAGSLIPSAPNQSFNGFFSKLFVAGPDRWYLFHAPGLATALYGGASALLIAATVLLCWPRGDIRRFGELEFALIVAAINLLTPYVWYYQLVLLLIPFFTLTHRALTVRRLRWMLAPLALGYVVTNLHGLFWQPWAYSPILTSMPFFTTLTLWGLLAYLIMRGKWGSGLDAIEAKPYHPASQ